jgi:hypothetical protein
MADGRNWGQPLKDIHIYLEGGGDTSAQKAQLRQGMSVFLGELKKLAREKGCHWNLVPCGGRQQTWDAFSNAPESSTRVNILIVDAEEPISHERSSCQHLHARDSWAILQYDVDKVFLMIQCMESWIVSDPEGLKKYYGAGFNENPIPRNPDLESVAKLDVYSALATATRNTQKGVYGKIKHASQILQIIDPEKAKRRSPELRRLFEKMKLYL